METQFTIKNGPSKLDLSIALLKGRKEIDDVDFKVTADGESFLIQCSIQMIQMEDGSHESWNLEGYAKLPEANDAGRPHRKFKAYFHTIKRCGHITVQMD